MIKAGYEGATFWAFIEKLFITELERMKVQNQSNEMKSAVLATICFAIKDSKQPIFSNDFWSKLNDSIATYLKNKSQKSSEAAADSVDESDETLVMLRMAVETNRRLEYSLLNLFP